MSRSTLALSCWGPALPLRLYGKLAMASVHLSALRWGHQSERWFVKNDFELGTLMTSYPNEFTINLQVRSRLRLSTRTPRFPSPSFPLQVSKENKKTKTQTQIISGDTQCLAWRAGQRWKSSAQTPYKKPLWEITWFSSTGWKQKPSKISQNVLFDHHIAPNDIKVDKAILLIPPLNLQAPMLVSVVGGADPVFLSLEEVQLPSYYRHIWLYHP